MRQNSGLNDVMNRASRSSDSLAGYAVGMAAGCRDVMRAAQFYTRDMSYVDGRTPTHRIASPLLSRMVAHLARFADRLMTWSANTTIALVVPSWRKLPSPFAPGMMSAVASAIRDQSLLHNPLFNSYFYRSAVAITNHYAATPNLLLEHRVDAARHRLTQINFENDQQTPEIFLAQAFLALVQTAPVARVGPSRRGLAIFDEAEPNLVVFAIACLTLLCAGQGRPMDVQDEEEFFAIIGALIHPRLGRLQQLVTEQNLPELVSAFAEIKDLY